MAELYDESVRSLSMRAKVGLGFLAVVALGAVVASPRLFFPVDSPQVATADLRAEPTTPTPSDVGSENPAISTPPASSQELVKTTDATTGIQVEAPADWSLATLAGAAVLQSDACGSSTVVFYPVILENRELEAESILTLYLGVVTEALKSAQGTLEPGSIRRASAHEASVLFTGTACQNPIRGQASVVLTGSRALIKLAWTPETLAESLQTTITAMLQRYRTTDTGMFLVVEGSRLEIAAPASWTTTEQAQSITASSENLLVRTTVLPRTDDVSLDSLLDTWLQLERDAGTELTDLTTRTSAALADVTDTTERSWSMVSREITYTQGGTPLRGFLTAAHTPELGDTALLTWRQAPISDWDTQASLLLAIERSIRLLPKSGLIASESGPFQLPYGFLRDTPAPLLGMSYASVARTTSRDRWSEIILTYARVRSPNDATVYLAPQTAVRTETGTYAHPNAAGATETLQAVVE